MALGDSYADLTELKSRVGITDALDDTAMVSALAVASRGIELACHRQFNDAGVASARVYYPTASWVVHVDDFHTTAGLLVATDSGSDGAYETSWAGTDFELYPLNGVVDGTSGWAYNKITSVVRWFPMCTARAPVQVTARWGWASVPPPIKEATLILAEDIFKLKDSPFGAGGYGEYGRIRARENPHVCLRIDPYVRDALQVA